MINKILWNLYLLLVSVRPYCVSVEVWHVCFYYFKIITLILCQLISHVLVVQFVIFMVFCVIFVSSLSMSPASLAA